MANEQQPTKVERSKSLTLRFQCPECGVQQRILAEQMDHQLRCSECGATYYVSNSGTLKLGREPRTIRSGEDLRQKSSKSLHIQRDVKEDKGWTLDWRHYAMGTVALTSLIALAVVSWMLVKSCPKPPSDLEARAKYVAEMIVANDISCACNVSASGTRRAAEQWVREMREVFYAGPQTILSVNQVKLLFEDSNRNLAGVSMNLHARLPGQPAPGPSDRGAVIVVYWTRENGAWMLDGATTKQNYAAGSNFQ